MSKQALAFDNSDVVSRYQNWLKEMATSAGLTNVAPGRPTSTSTGNAKNIPPYVKQTFPLNATGRLEQIAEFLRRFHRTEYMHVIQSVKPTPAGASQPGVFNVVFRIEALSLPQIKEVIIPSVAVPAFINDEERMLRDIRTRAILTEYTAAPVRLRVLSKTVTSVTMSWPSSIDADTHEIRYKRTADADTARSWRTMKFDASPGTIEALIGETEYEFQIRGINEIGAAAWSTSITTTTLPPPPPLVLSYTTDESVTLNWPPNDNVETHEIRYKRTDDPNQRNWVMVPFEGTIGTVDKLLDETEYEFQIRPKSADPRRPLPWSASVLATTLEREGPPPIEFDSIRFCFLNSIVEVDGKPQCWIIHRPSGNEYKLFERQDFQLDGFRIVIKKIEVATGKIFVEIWVSRDVFRLFSLRVGKHFDEVIAVERIP
jgi:hypothetical protein